MRASGPSLVRWFAHHLLPHGEREAIVGDLEELYAIRRDRFGRGRAARLYVADAVRSVVSRRRPRLQPRPAGAPARRRRHMMTGLVSDLRSAGRAVRREPGFAAIVVFTLALGVGSTVAVFGMVNQLMLRALPGAAATGDVGYLALRSRSNPDDPNALGLTTTDFDDLRREASAFAGVASYGRSSLTLRSGGRRPIEVRASTVYGDYFEVLGVRPSAGRLLSAAETELGSDPLVAVISESLRASLFAPSEAVVGRTMMLNGQPVRILGVAGGGFRGAERGDDYEVWLPYGALVPLVGFDAATLRERRSTMHNELVVRLREGITPFAAESEVVRFLERLALRYPEDAEYLAGMLPVVYPGLHSPPMWRANTYATRRLLGGTVVVVLLIACANVANLLLVRNVKRRGALAMRRALGASSARIARLALLESMLLAAVGTLAGFVVAWLMSLLFRGERLVRMPAFESFTVDGRVLAFAAAATLLTAVLFGALPAWLAGRFDLGAALKAAGARDTGRTASIRTALSAAQIALSLALLIGSLLLTRTVRNLYAVDTGLDIDRVLALPLSLPRDLDATRMDALGRDLLTTVGVVPGVAGVALDLYGPHGPSMLGRIGLPGGETADLTRAQMVPVTPGWFDMFGVRAVSGRTFRAQDWRSGTPSGVVLTASLARRLFGREDVAGRRVAAGFGELAQVEVVGVIGDIRMAHTPGEPRDAFFMTFDNAPPFPMATLLMRTTTDAVPAAEIRTAVERVLPSEPVPDPVPLTDRVDDIHSERRIFSNLLELLSTLAVLLAAVGLYGVLAFNVAGRRREFGVRLALGARATSVAGLVARYAVLMVGAGIGLGLFMAYAFSRLLENRLFQVEATDPATYAAAAALLALVGACACLTPALSAMRVDPARTLREE
jgi:putative ABC transport system permease protein